MAENKTWGATNLNLKNFHLCSPSYDPKSKPQDPFEGHYIPSDEDDLEKAKECYCNPSVSTSKWYDGKYAIMHK